MSGSENGIPFRGILTTNFDDVLPGCLPASSAFRAMLREEHAGRRSLIGTHRRFRAAGGTLTIKLHGDLAEPKSVVFSRTDYRRRLYSDHSYLGFLRAC